jgi:hypothetical protein
VTGVIFKDWENHRGAVFLVISGTVASFPVRVKLEMNNATLAERKERKEMDWKKSLGAVVLAGLTAFSLAGCGNNNEVTASATESPSSTIEQPAPPTGNITMPAPPQGMVPGGMPSDNGTMPAPPEGMGPGERPPAPTLDLAAAAAVLGVTEEALTAALGDTAGGPVDMQAAAEKLGVTVDALREALGMPEGALPPDAPPPGAFESTAPVQ